MTTAKEEQFTHNTIDLSWFTIISLDGEVPEGVNCEYHIQSKVEGFSSIIIAFSEINSNSLRVGF